MAKSESQRAKDRKEQGLCCSCNNPATKGVRCQDCWQRAKDLAAARYQKRKADGLCGMCGKNPKTEGYATCEGCRKQQNETRRSEEPRVVFDKPWHQRNKEAGFCTLGGEKHDRPKEGSTLCDACLQKKRDRYQARTGGNQCKLCTNPASPGRRKCEACREKAQKQRQENVDNGLCAECGNQPPEEGRRICSGCLSEGRVKDKRKRIKLRDAAFEAYGGYVCKCCGETEKLFLQIDHVNNDGAKHRREVFGKKSGSGQNIYRWLRDNNFPEGFQVLCANCNLGKHRNGGICPHH